MEIEIEANARIVALAVLAALLLFGLAGRAVTPVEHGEAQLLTPARWRAGKLERRAEAEVLRLRRDVEDIRSLMERDGDIWKDDGTEEVKVGVQWKYLADVVKRAAKRNLPAEVQISDPKQPLYARFGEDYDYLLMPVRLK